MYASGSSSAFWGACVWELPCFGPPLVNMSAGVVRRRMCGKQSAPHSYAVASREALLCEMAAADGLASLPLDGRRRHVHYTHSRTHGATDVQPNQLTREEFWKHMVRCYAEAYPDADSATGSVLRFGLVVKELHRDADRESDRSEHHHVAIFTKTSHFWKRVRKISAERYRIHLNAAAHDSYTTMFKYLRVPTSKKKVHELDAAPYFSADHPQGDELQELLAKGEQYLTVRVAKAPSNPATPQIRSHVGIVYNWVIERNLRKRKGAEQLQMDAVAELREGRPQLLEFVKKHRHSLEDELEFCWQLYETPERMQRLDKSRIEILLEVATGDGRLCENGDGACSNMYNAVLDYQGVCQLEFCHVIFNALHHGRRKGNAVMIVGGKDTGKTTVTEPARDIFHCMSTPQSDSFCPLQNARGHEVFLWQDLRYNPGHPQKEMQGLRLDEGTWNRLLEGLPTNIGVAKSDASRGDFTYNEDASFIFTGPFELKAYRGHYVDEKETEQLACRMKYIFFSRAAPQVRNRGFKHCPMCWSRWILKGEAQWQRLRGIAPDSFLQKVLSAIPVECVQGVGATQPVLPVCLAQGSADVAPVRFERLREMIAWHEQGYLTNAQFESAKLAMGLGA
jgi:hypothetical protein